MVTLQVVEGGKLVAEVGSLPCLRKRGESWASCDLLQTVPLL